jgi:hypothetical protein
MTAETGVYNPGKYRISPIGCLKQEGQVFQKIKESRGVVFIGAIAGPLGARFTYVVFRGSVA